MKMIFIIGLFASSVCISAANRIVPVRAMKVTRAVIQEELPFSATITSPRKSRLSSQVDAMVTKVFVDAGDVVKTNDLLAKLDKELAELTMQGAKASLAEAKARLQEAIRKRDELEKLIKNQYLARSSYDTAVAEVQINKAVVKQLKAAYLHNKAVVSRYMIKAPYKGVISHKAIEMGEWIKVGDTLLELVDIDTLRVEVDVPQHYFNRLNINSKVDITSDVLPDLIIAGKISRIIPVANATARTFPVHIVIDNKGHKLTPGMTARVVFQIINSSNSDNNSMLIPSDAVVKQSQNQEVVWLIKDEPSNMTVQAVPIKTGRKYKDKVEILEGNLSPGQQVVVRGNELLKQGQKVRLIP